jgi:uncharacterized glyoxalase superfamily protein PhnB
MFAQAVTAGAAIRRPLVDMFWGDRHGQLEDIRASLEHRSAPARRTTR